MRVVFPQGMGSSMKKEGTPDVQVCLTFLAVGVRLQLVSGSPGMHSAAVVSRSDSDLFRSPLPDASAFAVPRRGPARPRSSDASSGRRNYALNAIFAPFDGY